MRRVEIETRFIKNLTGYFHGFYNFGNASNMDIVAVVETEDGQVSHFLAREIRFIDKPNSESEKD